MKKLFIIALFCPLINLAQNSLLYEVTNPNSGMKSYLFGTMHVQDDRAFNFNDSVYWAIDQCSKAAFELDLNAESLKLKDSVIFSELFDDEYIQRLSDFLTLQLLPQIAQEIPQEEFARILIEDIMGAYLQIIEQSFARDNRSMAIDLYLQAYARTNEKNIIGIETIQEQLKALLTDVKNIDLTDPKISKAIVNQLQSGDIKPGILGLIAGTDRMTEAYASNTLSSVCDILSSQVAESNALGQMFYKRLFNDRNQEMFERTVDFIEEGEIFIAVGSGHLCGTSGLIEQYRSIGFTVRPMNISSSYQRPIVWEDVPNARYRVKLPQGVSISEPKFVALGAKEDYNDVLFTNLGMAQFTITTTDKERLPIGESSLGSPEIQPDGVYDSPAEETEIYSEDEPILLEENTTDQTPQPIGQDVVSETESIEAAPVEIEYEKEVSDEIRYTEDQPVSPNQPIQDKEGTSPKKRLRVLSDDMQSRMSEEDLEYFEGVFELVKDSIQQQVMGLVMQSMKGRQMHEVDSTRTVTIDGVKEVLVYEKTILGARLHTSFEASDKLYNLEVTGDPKLLQSKEIEEFFTSFKPRL